MFEIRSEQIGVVVERSASRFGHALSIARTPTPCPRCYTFEMTFSVRALIAASLLVLAACTSGETTATPEPLGGPETTLSSGEPTTDGSTPASEGGAQGEADPQPAQARSIDWSPCGSFECGTLVVPLDHDDPTGPTIEIAVTRRVSTSSSRIGSLFLNFGGPGGESGEIIQSAGLFFASLFGDFDIVVWDPRGTGETERLACDDAGVEDIGVGVVDPSDGFDEELEVEAAAFEVIAECAEATGPVIDHLSTADVARDLDLLREAVGDDGLTYLGYSYGTQIGWVYATLFPENVRALILDGAVPPGSLSGQGLVEQYGGFERTFAAFEQWCDDATSCQAADEGLGVRVDRLVAQLDEQPIVTPGGVTFGADDLLEGVLNQLYGEAAQTGPALDGFLAAVDRGDPSGFLDDAAGNAASSTPGAYKAVSCADGFDIASEAESIDQMTAMLEAAPRFGRLNEGIRCDLWPGEVEPLPELDSTGAPTILVVGSTLDPATPYESAIELDELLADSVLLTYDGTGHTIVGGDACINGYAIDYLVDLIPPPPGTVCTAR